MHTIDLDSALEILSGHEELSRAEIESLFSRLLLTRDETGWAAVLSALAVKGESVEEVTGVVEWLRSRAISIPIPSDMEDRVIDCCGTGGDQKHTLNISTLAALVAAAGNAPIMKHGNRSASGNFGSIDLVEALGLPIAHDPSTAVSLLKRSNIVFLNAPSFHPALKDISGIRKKLGIPTIFNIAAPLAHPAWIQKQIVGVWRDNYLDFLPQILCEIGIQHGLVVFGKGLDEFTTLDVNEYARITGTDEDIIYDRLDPTTLDLCPISEGSLMCLSRADYIDKAQKVIGGELCPESDIVALNAGAIFVINEDVETIAEGFSLAREIITSGTLKKKVEELKTI